MVGFQIIANAFTVVMVVGAVFWVKRGFSEYLCSNRSDLETPNRSDMETMETSLRGDMETMKKSLTERMDAGFKELQADIRQVDIRLARVEGHLLRHRGARPGSPERPMTVNPSNRSARPPADGGAPPVSPRDQEVWL